MMYMIIYVLWFHKWTYGAPIGPMIAKQDSLIYLLFFKFTTPIPEAAIDFSDYDLVTKSNTGCSCWFDPFENFTSAGDCACCENNGIQVVQIISCLFTFRIMTAVCLQFQCGYPMHNHCQPKFNSSEVPRGCKGDTFHEQTSEELFF